jgi:hypothetical protein
MSKVSHESRPELYGALLAPFALHWRTRLLALALLWLVRVPGAGTWLLRYQARRNRQ